MEWTNVPPAAIYRTPEPNAHIDTDMQPEIASQSRLYTDPQKTTQAQARIGPITGNDYLTAQSMDSETPVFRPAFVPHAHSSEIPPHQPHQPRSPGRDAEQSNQGSGMWVWTPIQVRDGGPVHPQHMSTNPRTRSQVPQPYERMEQHSQPEPNPNDPLLLAAASNLAETLLSQDSEAYATIHKLYYARVSEGRKLLDRVKSIRREHAAARKRFARATELLKDERSTIQAELDDQLGYAMSAVQNYAQRARSQLDSVERSELNKSLQAQAVVDRRLKTLDEVIERTESSIEELKKATFIQSFPGIVADLQNVASLSIPDPINTDIRSLLSLQPLRVVLGDQGKVVGRDDVGVEVEVDGHGHHRQSGKEHDHRNESEREDKKSKSKESGVQTVHHHDHGVAVEMESMGGSPSAANAVRMTPAALQALLEATKSKYSPTPMRPRDVEKEKEKSRERGRGSGRERHRRHGHGRDRDRDRGKHDELISRKSRIEEDRRREKERTARERHLNTQFPLQNKIRVPAHADGRVIPPQHIQQYYGNYPQFAGAGGQDPFVEKDSDMDRDSLIRGLARSYMELNQLYINVADTTMAGTGGVCDTNIHHYPYPPMATGTPAAMSAMKQPHPQGVSMSMNMREPVIPRRRSSILPPVPEGERGSEGEFVRIDRGLMRGREKEGSRSPGSGGGGSGGERRYREERSRSRSRERREKERERERERKEERERAKEEERERERERRREKRSASRSQSRSPIERPERRSSLKKDAAARPAARRDSKTMLREAFLAEQIVHDRREQREQDERDRRDMRDRDEQDRRERRERERERLENEDRLRREREREREREEKNVRERERVNEKMVIDDDNEAVVDVVDADEEDLALYDDLPEDDEEIVEEQMLAEAEEDLAAAEATKSSLAERLRELELMKQQMGNEGEDEGVVEEVYSVGEGGGESVIIEDEEEEEDEWSETSALDRADEELDAALNEKAALQARLEALTKQAAGGADDDDDDDDDIALTETPSTTGTGALEEEAQSARVNAAIDEGYAVKESFEEMEQRRREGEMREEDMYTGDELNRYSTSVRPTALENMQMPDRDFPTVSSTQFIFNGQ